MRPSCSSFSCSSSSTRCRLDGSHGVLDVGITERGGAAAVPSSERGSQARLRRRQELVSSSPGAEGSTSPAGSEGRNRRRGGEVAAGPIRNISAFAAPRLHGPTRALPPAERWARPCRGPSPGSRCPALPDTGGVTGKGTALRAEGTPVLQAGSEAPVGLHAQEILGGTAVSQLHPGAPRRGQQGRGGERCRWGTGFVPGSCTLGSSTWGPSASPREMPSRWAGCGEGPRESWGPDILMRFSGEETQLFQPPPAPKSSWSSFRWTRVQQDQTIQSQGLG